MTQAILLAFPMALFWMIVARSGTPQTFLVGYVLGLATVAFLRANTRFPVDVKLKPSRIPGQLFAFLAYVWQLLIDILASGIDVAWRVLAPNINDHIHPKMVRIPTHDDNSDTLVEALSAHAITITPGSLVVDFEDDNRYMIVHVLDGKTSDYEALSEAQKARAKQLNKILGK